MTNCNTILIGYFYRRNKHVSYKPFIDFIENLVLNFNNIVIALAATCFEKVNFQRISANIKTPTPFTETSCPILDIFFVNDKSKLLIYDQLAFPNFPKLDLIFLTYDFITICNEFSFSYRDFQHIDYKQLEEAIDATDRGSVQNLLSSSYQVSFIRTHINTLYEKFVPLVTKSTSVRSSPWFDNYIRQLIHKRNMAYRKWKRSRCQATYSGFKARRRDVTKAIKQKKLKYYEHQFSIAIDSKQTKS